MVESSTTPQKQKSLGCIMGAFIGDSLGSYLEFVKKGGKRFYSESVLKEAMSMPGGGMHKVAPGQITDDSEMALCLLHGLIAGKGKLNLKEIVK